jgi:hypothetical protein
VGFVCEYGPYNLARDREQQVVIKQILERYEGPDINCFRYVHSELGFKFIVSPLREWRYYGSGLGAVSTVYYESRTS